jgi:hypothetical protein
MSEFDGHTPGPWTATRDDRIKGNDYVISGQMQPSNGDTEISGRAKANARLIAAAPALLARAERAEKALDDLVMALDLPGDHCELAPALERARAALTRAGASRD